MRFADKKHLACPVPSLMISGKNMIIFDFCFTVLLSKRLAGEIYFRLACAFPNDPRTKTISFYILTPGLLGMRLADEIHFRLACAFPNDHQAKTIFFNINFFNTFIIIYIYNKDNIFKFN